MTAGRWHDGCSIITMLHGKPERDNEMYVIQSGTNLYEATVDS